MARNVAHQKIVNVPIYFDFHPREASWSVLDSGMLKCIDPEPGRFREKRADAWRMRDEFFHIRRGDVPKLVAFLTKWGPWAEHYGKPEISQEWGANPEDLTTFYADAIWQTQDRFRHGLTHPRDWFTSTSNILKPTETQTQFPPWGLTVTSCALAMKTSITLDLLSKAKFCLCARRDCQAPFPVTSQHERKYCCQYCGHLESIRRSRKPKEARHGKAA